MYNANKGAGSGLMGSLHKAISPKTYECNLCRLTHGVFAEKKAWRNFRKRSEVEMIFLHKEEYQDKFKSKFESLYDLPVILYQDNYDLSVMVKKEELNQMEEVETLIEKLETRL